MRIWLVGGGTGGHVSPLRSLAAEIKKSSSDAPELLMVTDRSRVTTLLLADEKAITVERIFSGKLRRYKGRNWLGRLLDAKTWLLNLRDGLLIAIGIIQSFGLVLSRRPDVIFINGGSIGVPIALAARAARVPYIIHESDVILGLANKLIAAHASKIATAFDVNLGDKLAAKTVTSGIPLASQFLESPDENNLKNLFNGMNLDANLPIVLAVGGSLGAERLNNWLLSQVDEIVDKCQLILVTGHKNYQSSQTVLASQKPVLMSRLHLLEFTDRMADLMRIADLVITRAGATTLMELAAVGRPAIIVPMPTHQSSNAQWFVDAGMAESLSEDDIAADPAILARTVHAMLSDEPRQRRLSEAIAKVFKPDSAAILAQLIQKTGRGE